MVRKAALGQRCLHPPTPTRSKFKSKKPDNPIFYGLGMAAAMGGLLGAASAAAAKGR